MIAHMAAAALAAITVTGQSPAQSDGERARITVFDRAGYEGRSMVIDGDAPDLRWVRFNDTISSIRVEGGQWELCLEPEYRGACQVIDESLPDMTEWAFNDRVTSIQAVHRPDRDQREGVTLYEGRSYTGRSINIVRVEEDLSVYSFNDAANAIEVHSGVWTLCEGRDFTGRCVEVDRDSNDLTRFRMDDRLSALSPAGVPRQEPQFGPVDGYRPGDDYRPGPSGSDIQIDGAIPGIGVMFFREPSVSHMPIAACADRAERRCGRAAADLLCRDAGFNQAAYHAVKRIPARTGYRLDERATGRTRDILVDVLCTR